LTKFSEAAIEESAQVLTLRRKEIVSGSQDLVKLVEIQANSTGGMQEDPKDLDSPSKMKILIYPKAFRFVKNWK
jgi:hypothetical protein